jgi:hypothetical protein
MPGFISNVSVIVAPPLAVNSRDVATVTATNDWSSTMAPGSGCSSTAGSGTEGASVGSPEAGAVLVDLCLVFFGLATGLAVVTVTAGNCTVFDACGAAGCACP